MDFSLPASSTSPTPSSQDADVIAAVPASKGRGRRRDETIPESRKQQLSRDAQRAWRERQKANVQQLQKQVVEFRDLLSAKNTETAALRAGSASLAKENDNLKAQLALASLASGSSSGSGSISGAGVAGFGETCASCQLERGKAAFFQAQLSALQLKIMALQTEVNSYKDLIGSSLSASIVAPSSVNSHKFDFTFSQPVPAPTLALAPINPLHAQHQQFQNQVQPMLPVGADFSSFENSPQAAPSAVSTSLSTTPNAVDDWVDFDTVAMSLDFSSSFHPQNACTFSATDLYGPIRDQVARYCLKSIPSLVHEGKLVDAMFSHMAAETKTADRNKLKRHWMRMIAAWHSVLDACKTVQDRNQALEVFLAFSDLNRAHFDHISLILTTVPDTVQLRLLKKGSMSSLNQSSKQVIQTLKSIPSLSSSGELIDELVLSCSNLSSISSEEFIDLTKKVKQLQDLCVMHEDRTRLFYVLNEYRQVNKEESHTLISQMLQELDNLTI
ncbi:hypothetical protein BC830DRAFT_1164157 [Chytriomyces sp. MP71]|nr:hypothetical protein BC830DRAFT_1164157 [Chytriomyces sp. MP71]